VVRGYKAAPSYLGNPQWLGDLFGYRRGRGGQWETDSEAFAMGR